MTGVKLRRSIVTSEVVSVLDDVGFAGRERVVVKRLGIGVRAQELKAMREVLVDGDPQSVVVRVAIAVDLIDVVERARRIWSQALRRNDGACERKSWERLDAA